MIFTGDSNGISLLGNNLSFKNLFKDITSSVKGFSLGQTLGEMLIKKEDLTNINKFFNDVAKSGQTVKDFASANSNYFGDMDQSLQNCITSSSSYGEAVSSMGVQIAISTAKMIAFRVAAIALNAAVTALVSGAISWGLSKLNDFIHQSEKIKEAASNAKTSINEIKSGLQDKTSLVNDNIEKFIELSKGVDSLTGKNKSLSTDSYQEFLSISNQLAETFPSLSRTYDENGNAIVNLGGNVDQAKSQLQELLEVERQLANQDITSNLSDIFKGVELEHNTTVDNIKAYQTQIDDAMVALAKTSDSFKWDANLFTIDESQFKKSNGVVDTASLEAFKNQVRTGLNSLGIAYNEILDDGSFVLDWGGLSQSQRTAQQKQIQEYFSIDAESINQTIATSKQKIAQLKEANKQNWAGLVDSLDTWMTTDSSFSVMNDSMKSVVQKMVGNLDFSSLYETGNFTGIEDFQNYIQQKIVDPIKNLSESDQIRLSDLFNLDTSDTSVDDYVNKIKTTIEDIANNSGEITAEELFDLTGLKTVSDEYEKAGEELKSLLTDAGDHELELGNLSVDETLTALDAVRERGITTWDELDALFNNGVLKPDIDISAETDAIKSVYEAIQASNGATGLAAENIAAIKSRYQDLDGYDYSKVFQRTSTGIKTNVKAVQELEEEYNNLQKAQQQAKLDDLIDQYDKLTEKMIAASGNPVEYGQLAAQRDSILQDINDCADLITQYEGLTSAYNKWLEAKSAGNARDKYSDISSGYDDAEKAIEQGWYGDASLNEYLDLMLSASQRTGDAVDDFNKLKQTIGDTGYSIWDFIKPDDDGNLTTDGLFNMLDAVHALDDSLVQVSDGNYSFDWSGDKLQKVADMLGMSTEAVQILEEAMQDAGFDIVFDSMFTDVDKLNKGLEGTVQKFNELAESGLKGFNGESIDVDTSGITGTASTIEEATSQLETLKSVLDQMKDSSGKIDFTLEGASEAAQIFASLMQQKAELENPAIMKFDCDASGVEESVAEATALLQEFITANTSVEILTELGLDTSEAEANVQALLEKMQGNETITKDMQIDTSSAESAIKSISDNGDAINKTLNIDTSEAESKLDNLGTDGGGTIEKKVSLTVEEQELLSLQNQLANMQADIPVTFNVQSESLNEAVSTAKTPITTPVTFTPEHGAVDTYAAEEKSGTGKVHWDNDQAKVATYAAVEKSGTGWVHWNNDTSNVQTTFSATGTINWINSGGPSKAGGTVYQKGTAYAKGTIYHTGNAYQKGNWGVKHDETALVGEQGEELLCRNGFYQTIGEDSAELVKLKKGDIIFNAEQTKQILEKGKITSGSRRGLSYALGTIGSAYDTGTGGKRRSAYSAATTTSTSSTSSSSKTSTSSTSSSKSSTSSSTSSKSSSDDEPEKFDWVEIAIDRLDRLIDSLEKTADSAYLVISKRLSAASDEIAEVTNMIALQQQAYDRYIQEANSIGLSSDLAEKVMNGTIDISEYDKDTKDLIADFQEWFEKALDCQDAIDDLAEKLGDLYKQKFDDNKTEFGNQISLVEHLINTYETGLEILEEKGLFASANYYKAEIQAQQEMAATLKKELDTLTQSMSDAVNSGAIEEGSEAYYEMQQEINDVKESLQKTELEVIKLNNAIRDLEWEKFDYALDRISKLNDEAEFFIDLMSHEKMFDEAGNITEQGVATLAMYGQEYNVLMAQADMYADEMKKVQDELASDPNNQELIERYEELQAAQRECILEAEDMKEAVKDLVKEGIEIELDALKELIDSYNDLNDSQRDLYEYQKKVAKQTKEIASLQKQLAALQGDDSQETKLRVQKIKLDLEDALDELKETENEYLISEQKKMLDNLYDEYETILNERLDDIDVLFDEVIASINDRALEVNDTISAEAKEVGYTISDTMSDIWSNQTLTTLSTYHNDFLIQFTAVTDALNKIVANTTQAGEEADAIAEETITNTTPTTEVTKPAVVDTPTPEPVKEEKLEVKVGQRVKADPNTPIYWDSLGTVGPNGSHQYFASDPVYIVTKEANGYVAVRHHTQQSVAGWFKKNQVTAFKRGGLADFTGPAWLDGSKSKPEIVLNPEETKAFLELTEALRQIRAEDFKIDTSKFTVKENAGTNFGDIVLNIAIDHVQDYNDFAKQLQNDPTFEKMVQDMTVGRLQGKSSLNKYRHYK